MRGNQLVLRAQHAFLHSQRALRDDEPMAVVVDVGEADSVGACSEHHAMCDRNRHATCDRNRHATCEVNFMLVTEACVGEHVLEAGDETKCVQNQQNC